MASKTSPTGRRSATVNLRLQASARELIDRAAEACGKSRTEFMVEAARREAESVLLDRCFFALGQRAFTSFKAALDRPPVENRRLAGLLETAAPWD